MSRLIAPLALVVALLSLGLNAVLLIRLNQARVGALDVLDRTSQRLDALSDVSFTHSVHVQQNLDVSGTLPFKQDFTVPIKTTVPINTTAQVNVNTPLGPVNVPVTINTSVPIDLEVPVTISQTVPYSLSVPVDLQVPIEIRLRDVGIDAAVQEIKAEIQRLRSALQ